MPINTEFFGNTKAHKAKFNELFYLYVKTIDKKDEAIRGIDFHVVNNNTVNFTV